MSSYRKERRLPRETGTKQSELVKGDSVPMEHVDHTEKKEDCQEKQERNKVNKCKEGS
jgi:hypothetical protein